MITMDVFNDDAFSAVSLTNAIEAREYVPDLLDSLGLFTPVPVRTETVAVERRGTTLRIIPTSERGAPRPAATRDRRNITSFQTVRLSKTDKLMASELANIRQFGSETEVETMAVEVARRQLKLDLEMRKTEERHRLGALAGQVLDADGSIIEDYFDAFGISQPAAITFNWATWTLTQPDAFIKQNIVRPITQALDGMAVAGMQIHALCGSSFYDAITGSAAYTDSLRATNEARRLLEGNPPYSSIRAFGVNWHEYRGSNDGTVGIAANQARFFVTGVPDVFQVALSPAESFEFVNTLGRERYSRLIRDDKRDEWVEVELSTYPLFMCTRPEILLRGQI